MSSGTPSIADLNSLIAKAQQAIACDATCQQQQTAAKLKKKWQDAQASVEAGPALVDNARQEYITFTQGESAFHSQREIDLHTTAQRIVDEFQQQTDAEAEKITHLITTYDGVTSNYENVVELYLKYRNENATFTKQIKNQTSDVLTNERKTYYENQGIDSLHFYYRYILLFLYIIAAGACMVSCFVFPSKLSWKHRLAGCIVLVILPFVSSWMLSFFLRCMYGIYEILPKNVNRTMSSTITPTPNTTIIA